MSEFNKNPIWKYGDLLLMHNNISPRTPYGRNSADEKYYILGGNVVEFMAYNKTYKESAFVKYKNRVFYIELSEINVDGSKILNSVKDTVDRKQMKDILDI